MASYLVSRGTEIEASENSPNPKSRLGEKRWKERGGEERKSESRGTEKKGTERTAGIGGRGGEGRGGRWMEKGRKEVVALWISNSSEEDRGTRGV